MTKNTIEKLLTEITEPVLGTDLMTAGVVKTIDEVDGRINITLAFPYPAASAFREITEAAQVLFAQQGVANVRFNMETKIYAHTVQGGVERLPGVKNVIAIASAKGGVGKSTTAANIALALAHEGARVGILDADIYGPSLPVMLGITQRPQGGEEGGIRPVITHSYGLQVMSIGFMVEQDQPMVWRGPIATRALLQLLRETQWDNLDYLVLDMPPGTGDIQLTIAQQIPVTGAIIVTTPQELAVADARRGLVMFNKVSIPVLGVVENMSSYICSCCNHETFIFGRGGGEKMCAQHQVELLGSLPLAPAIREQADEGLPSVAADPTGEISCRYRKIAVRVAAKIAEKSRDRSAAFPKIVVTD